MIRSKIVTAIVTASAFFATAAFAADISGAFGNTVKMTNAKGNYEFYWKEDGTVGVKLPDGSADTAKWTLAGNDLCAVSDKDASKHCFMVPDGPSKAVGDKWEGKDDEGNDASFEMVAGAP